MSKLVTAVVATFVGLALAGCAPDFVRSSFEDQRVEAGKVTEINIAGGSGSLIVERSSASGVNIKRKVSYLRDRPDRRFDTLQGETLNLDSDCGEDCTVDYTITVPEAVKVAGRLG